MTLDDDELAALRAEVARQGHVLYGLVYRLGDTLPDTDRPMLPREWREEWLAELEDDDAPAPPADALAAWARAQQQPALGDNVREAMREAIDALDDAGKRLRHPLNTDDQLRAGDACYAASARLRELAGERGRGFATIPGWRAGEP